MPRPKKVLLFEWLTSGGLWRDRIVPSSDCSMQKQGREMLLAIAKDFLTGGLEVALPIDSRLQKEIPNLKNLSQLEIRAADDLRSRLFEMAMESDYVMVIAPETAANLSNCLLWLKDFESKLINPNIAFTQLVSNKQLTFEHLRSNGFQQVPQCVNFAEHQESVERFKHFPLPSVLKPIDGAGSEEVVIIDDWNSWCPNLSRPLSSYCLEAFVEGTPVSVSVVGSGDGYELLTPTKQLFDQSRRSEGLMGEYVRGEYPITPATSARALRLARQAVEALPPTRGYFGIDMVIGELNGQPNDVLIEINPRLTSSYLKLREIYPENLAMLILEKATTPVPVSSVSSVRPCTFRVPCP